MFRRCCIVLCLLLCSLPATNAQTYPVQLSVQLVPPFSGYLPDYASPGNDNLRIFITLTDFSQPTYNVKLKFKLTGNNVTIQNKSWYYAGPFTVEPGVPLMLTGTDLAGMLAPVNLDYSGLTLQQYNQTKVLPEGFYTISVLAYDYLNPLPIQVSNEAITQAWMMLCDPPLINLPACGSELTPTSVQQITFSWTPLNMSSPSSALGTEYLFELWEVMPPNNAPGNVVLSTAPIYSTTTSQTMLSYGLTEPPLQVGWTYVWRVRAYDLDGRELFRNNGYSVICTFSWGNSTLLLGNLANLTLSAQALTHRQARCMWDSASVYTNYHLEFRKVNTANWFPLNTTQANVRITNLEPLTTYEAQVQGIFPNGEDGPWSNIVTFTTPAQATLNCGETSLPPAQQNFSPLTQASQGMIWQVGQFEMIVTQLTNTSNPNGLYSGLGKVMMPLGITVACTFTSIQIGTDQVMYAGEVNAITEGMGSWVTQWNVNYVYDTSYFYTGNIDSIYVNGNGEIVIIDENGNQVIVPIDPEGGVLITDSNGDQWIVNADGTVTLVNGGYLLPLTNDTLNAQEMRIMKAAMSIIRGELTSTALSSQENAMDVGEQQMQNRMNQQKQNATGGNVPPPVPVNGEEDEEVVFTEREMDPNNEGEVLGNNYKSAQLDYYTSQVLLVLSRENCPDHELDFIGQYLTVDGILYANYVTQQIATGKTETEIAALVAQNGIKQLVRMTLIHQMSPH